MLCLALTAAAACGGSDDEAQPSDTTADSPAATEPATGGSEVTLEEAGREPRQPLRLRLTAGTTTRAAFVNRTDLEMSIEGNSLPVGTLPATRTVVEQRIDRVDPDGTAHFTVKFAEWTVEPTPGADPQAARQIQQVLDQLEGLSGTGTVDPSGGRQTLSMDTSRVSEPLMRSTLDSMASQVGNLAVPFPTEPVGPGARWRGTSTATINGITMNTTTRYTLRSRAGERYELDIVQDAEAPPGRVDIPNLPAGTETSIERFTVHSTGHVGGALTAHLPSTSAVQGEGEGRMTIVVEGERGTLVQRITLDATLSPA